VRLPVKLPLLQIVDGLSVLSASRRWKVGIINYSEYFCCLKSFPHSNEKWNEVCFY
jgi:hypothetical protein